MRKSTSGFTIVELLIVIVVIGIIAAIVTVAYTGIQSQAKNIKTVAAVDSWAKALQLYRVENGNFPVLNSCLGDTNTYQNVGYGVFCWDISYWDVKASLHNALAPYMNNYPEPDTTHVGGGATNRRGAFYQYISPTHHRIRAVFAGVTTCPSSSAGPVELTGQLTSGTAGVYCDYRLD